MAIPLLLDVDTGVDDAMAIALAACLPSHELVGVTTVAGNVTLENATRNTLRVLSWVGSDAPVYRGMSHPLVRPLHTATRIHGNDGLGGWDAPESARGVEGTSAPEAILRLARQHRGALDGVFVGPLTNLAVALTLEPELATWFRSVTIMGGAFFNPGNETPDAEFNIFVDPEAADIVARSGLAATWIGLDVTHQTYLSQQDWLALDGLSGGTPELVREVTRQTFTVRERQQSFLHDPLAVAVVSDPTLVGVDLGQILIDTGQFARGETRLSPGESTSGVARTVDVESFRSMFQTLLGLV